MLQFRVTPHSTTGCFPAVLLFGRNLRTRLDAIRPDLSRTVEKRQDQQKRQHDSRAKVQMLKDKVFVRNFGRGKLWLPGYLLCTSGPCSFMVKLLDGRVMRCHIDHLQPRVMDCEVPVASDLTLDDYLGPDQY